MATVLDAVRLALLKAQIINSGEAGEAEEIKDGLAVYQSLLDETVDAGGFGLLKDVVVSADYTPAEGDRVRVDGTATVTPPTLIYDADIGGSRAPLDLALVVVNRPADGAFERHLYEAPRGEWVRLDGLQATTEYAPLSSRGLDGLAAWIAERYAGQFGAALGAPDVLAARRFRATIASKVVARGSSGAEFF